MLFPAIITAIAATVHSSPAAIAGAAWRTSKVDRAQGGAVVFCRIPVLVALLLRGRCLRAGNDPPRQPPAVAFCRRSGPAGGDRTEVGGAYPDAALQAYVDRVGQKLVRSSASHGYLPLRRARPAGGQCSCAAGGYVFVTRGLLAVLDDEAELAAALGHELGHLTRRHAAQRARARQGVLEAAVEAATDTGRSRSAARWRATG